MRFWTALAWLGLIGSVLMICAVTLAAANDPIVRLTAAPRIASLQFRALLVAAVSLLWLIFG